MRLSRPGKARMATQSTKSYIYSVAGFVFRFWLRRLFIDARIHQPPCGPMPLIECSECGQKVASVASVCPRCSCVLGQRAEPVRRRRNSWAVPVLLVVVLVALGIFLTPRAIDNGSPLPTSSPPTPLPPATVDSPPAETPEATGPSTQAKWTSTWVNVREGRGTDTRIVQILDPGQRVEVDSLQGRWWVVVVDSESIGYIHNSVLQDESPSR